MGSVMEPYNEYGKFMKRAFQLAQDALDNDEVPVGCIFTYNGVEVGYGRNEVNYSKDPTAHAEMVALSRMHLEVPNINKAYRRLCMVLQMRGSVVSRVLGTHSSTIYAIPTLK